MDVLFQVYARRVLFISQFLISLIVTQAIAGELFLDSQSPATLQSNQSSPQDSAFESWVENQKRASVGGLLLNVSPPGVARGAVTASPSRSDPDYYYHWVRDASIVMSSVLDLYNATLSPTEKMKYEKLIVDFVEFSRRNQLTSNLSGGLGEPKFNLDGSAYSFDWGRPQNDGPALRALTLIRFARVLIDQGHLNWVRLKLYDGLIPTHSVIKSDLEFVSHHWREDSFDLWEEVRGQHFYTQMVQRRALLEGATLADDLEDPLAARWYRKQAYDLELSILKFWDESKKYFKVTSEGVGLEARKVSGLDVAVILGCLHGYAHDHFLSLSDDRVLSTAHAIKRAFSELYLVNRNKALGAAIGRYPEDIYDGHSVGLNQGNPWVLATLAFAELYHRVAQEILQAGQVRVTELNLPFFADLDGIKELEIPLIPGTTLKQSEARFKVLVEVMRKNADLYMKRIQHHALPLGRLSEQMNRDTGFMQGASDLAWSYASFLTAVGEREKLNQMLSP